MSNPKFEDTEEIVTPAFEETQDVSELPNINQPGVKDDLLAGARAAVRGLPFANNVKALYESATSDISYNEALGKEIEAENIDKKSFPVASTIGNVASFALPGLGAAKIANTASKALKLGKAATIAVGAASNIGFDTAFMAAKKIGDESDFSSENVGAEANKALKSAITGQALGMSAGLGLSLGSKFLGNSISKMADFALDNSQIIKNSLKGASKSIQDAAKKIDLDMGAGTFESVFKKLNISPDDIAQDPSLLKEAAKRAIAETGESIGNVYRNLDGLAQGAKIYSGSKLATSVKEVLNDYATKNDLPEQVGQKLVAQVDELFHTIDPETGIKITKSFSPKDLWDLRTKFNAEDYPLFKEITDKKFRDRIGGAFTENIKDAAAMYTAQVDGFISQFSKKGADGVMENPEFANQIKKSLEALPELNKTYAALNETNKKVFNKFVLPNDSVNQSSQVLQEALKVKFSDIKIAGAAALAAKSGPAGAIALGTLAGVRATRQYLSEMANFTNKDQLAQKFMSWEQGFAKAENLMSDPHVTGILSRLSQKMSADEPLNAHELDLAKSKINLYTNPLPRTTAAIKARLDDIIPLAEELGGKDYLQKLNEAVEMDDGSLPALIDQISKQPELQRYFEAGQGFDGILYGVDREMAAKNIMADRYLPTSTKNALIDEVMATGKVPNIEQFQRKPKVYSPRDKAKKRY